jgi:hypothetical protein
VNQPPEGASSTAWATRADVDPASMTTGETRATVGAAEETDVATVQIVTKRMARVRRNEDILV